MDRKRNRIEDGVPSPQSSSARDLLTRQTAENSKRKRPRDQQAAVPEYKTDSEGHLLLQSGDLIDGNYQVRRCSGTGTFGKVYLCTDLSTGQSVAVKVIRAVKRYVESAKVERDLLEDVSSAMPPPGRDGPVVPIVRYERSFDWYGHYCMVFEALGPSLYDYVKENDYKPLPLYAVQSFADQLLLAVAFMHEMRLVHTDLKLENVLLTHLGPDGSGTKVLRRCTKDTSARDGRPVLAPLATDIKIIDFGGATYDYESKTFLVNTRQYRSPEVILGLGWGPASDVWSVGCILMELYKGELLFPTHDNAEHLALMEQVLGPFPVPMVRTGGRLVGKYFDSSGRSRWPATARSRDSVRYVKSRSPLSQLVNSRDTVFLDLVTKMLALDPKQRITAKDAMNHRFFSVIRGAKAPPVPRELPSEQRHGKFPPSTMPKDTGEDDEPSDGDSPGKSPYERSPSHKPARSASARAHGGAGRSSSHREHREHRGHQDRDRQDYRHDHNHPPSRRGSQGERRPSGADGSSEQRVSGTGAGAAAGAHAGRDRDREHAGHGPRRLGDTRVSETGRGGYEHDEKRGFDYRDGEGERYGGSPRRGGAGHGPRETGAGRDSRQGSHGRDSRDRGHASALGSARRPSGFGAAPEKDAHPGSRPRYVGSEDEWEGEEQLLGIPPGHRPEDGLDSQPKDTYHSSDDEVQIVEAPTGPAPAATRRASGQGSSLAAMARSGTGGAGVQASQSDDSEEDGGHRPKKAATPTEIHAVRRGSSGGGGGASVPPMGGIAGSLGGTLAQAMSSIASAGVGLLSALSGGASATSSAVGRMTSPLREAAGGSAGSSSGVGSGGEALPSLAKLGSPYRPGTSGFHKGSGVDPSDVDDVSERPSLGLHRASGLSGLGGSGEKVGLGASVGSGEGTATPRFLVAGAASAVGRTAPAGAVRRGESASPVRGGSGSRVPPASPPEKGRAAGIRIDEGEEDPDSMMVSPAKNKQVHGSSTREHGAGPAGLGGLSSLLRTGGKGAAVATPATGLAGLSLART